MATGALIRDFEKDYRELRYSNSGSIELSEIEHNAYRAALTLEITHVDAPRYGSKKTLPDNTHYGYVTLFRGSTVTDTIAIKYPKFRVFDIRNQGIWNYHQLTESTQLNAGVSVAAANASGSGVLGRLGSLATGTICFLIGIDYAQGGGGPVSDFVLDFFDCDEPDGGSRDVSRRYRAFPIATPFPDIAKFKADIPCSFLWRLELWYLVNPAIYVADNPTDTGDETEGEDEYPEPEQGDGDGDGDEFPEPDPAPPDSDPRDFGKPLPSGEPPFTGGQCFDFYDVVVEYSDILNGTPRVFNRSLRVLGPILGFGPFSSTDNELSVLTNSQNYRTGIAAFPFPCATNPGSYTNCRVRFVSIVRVGGAPDDCGDPPPVPVE